MSKHDYSTPPVATGETRTHNPIQAFVFSLLGRGRSKGIRRVQLADGKEFQAYPVSSMIYDWSGILYGVTDLTGEYWRPVNNGKPCWNACELDGPMTANAGNPYLARLSEYRKSGAPLRTNPEEWPEPYKSAYFKD